MKGFWKPPAQGYTTDIDEAGFYSFADISEMEWRNTQHIVLSPKFVLKIHLEKLIPAYIKILQDEVGPMMKHDTDKVIKRFHKTYKVLTDEDYVK